LDFSPFIASLSYVYFYLIHSFLFHHFFLLLIPFALKLFIIYEPFENEMVDAGDITISSFQRDYQYLNTAILIVCFISYSHLAKLTVMSFRELLSTLHNWWHRGRFTFRLSNVYGDGINNNDDEVD
jgi:hypothetical protein